MQRKSEKIEFQVVNSIHSFDLAVTGYLNKILDNYGLNAHQFYIMELAEKLGTIGQDQVVHNMSVNKSNVTKILNSLEDNGMIKRKQSNVDKRSRLLELTDLGNETMDKIQKEIDEFYDYLFAEYTEYEKLSFIKMLRQLNGTIRKKAKVTF